MARALSIAKKSNNINQGVFMTPIHISENLFISPNIKKWFWLWMIDREVFKIKRVFKVITYQLVGLVLLVSVWTYYQLNFSSFCVVRIFACSLQKIKFLHNVKSRRPKCRNRCSLYNTHTKRWWRNEADISHTKKIKWEARYSLDKEKLEGRRENKQQDLKWPSTLFLYFLFHEIGTALLDNRWMNRS